MLKRKRKWTYLVVEAKRVDFLTFTLVLKIYVNVNCIFIVNLVVYLSSDILSLKLSP